MRRPRPAGRRGTTILAAPALIAIAIVAGGCSSAMAATVKLSPSNDVQQAVDANPPGTTFVLEAGTYRNASVNAIKAGDSFIGRPNAIMDGARQENGWTKVSIGGVAYWTAAAGIPLFSPRCGARASCCLADYPGCEYVQNLYVDDIEYRHVVSLADVVRTKWYYDFDGTDLGVKNNIYLALSANPNSHQVELGHATFAFTGNASDITIKNLIIEKYSAPIQSAAVQPQGPSWLIEHNEIRLNHGFGIKAKAGADNIRVRGNWVHHNGEMGIGSGRVSGGLWEFNDISYNNVDRVNPDFEAGGSKFVGNNIKISNNIVHDNYGTGLWTDEGATHNTYEHNTSYNNFGGGIRYEISRYGVIKNNIVYGNTKNAQIVYTGSDHGRISGNTVTNDGRGGIFVQNIVGTRTGATIYKVVDTQVVGNTIVISNSLGIAAGMLDFAQPPQPGIFSDPSIFFDHDVYKLPEQFRPANMPESELLWCWGENPGRGPRRVNWDEWQALRQDREGILEKSSEQR